MIISHHGKGQTAQSVQTWLGTHDELSRATIEYLRGVLESIAGGHPAPMALAADAIRLTDQAMPELARRRRAR